MRKRERKWERENTGRGRSAKGKESERSERQDQKGRGTGLADESFEPWSVGSSYISPERPCCFFNARTTSTHGNCGRRTWRCPASREKNGNGETRGGWRVLGGLRRARGKSFIRVYSQDDRVCVTIDLVDALSWHRIRGDRSRVERYDRSVCREARNWGKKGWRRKGYVANRQLHCPLPWPRRGFIKIGYPIVAQLERSDVRDFLDVRGCCRRIERRWRMTCSTC